MKECVDDERKAAGQLPSTTQNLYKANKQPDWWPPGVPVSLPGPPRGLAQRLACGAAPEQRRPIARSGLACLQGVAAWMEQHRCWAAADLPLPTVAPLTGPFCPAGLPQAQWGSRACEAKDRCLQIYGASRKVLAAIHDMQLQ